MQALTQVGIHDGGDSLHGLEEDVGQRGETRMVGGVHYAIRLQRVLLEINLFDTKLNDGENDILSIEQVY